VAALSFGFWPALYSGTFVQAIWTEQNRLTKSYPNLPDISFQQRIGAIGDVLRVATTLRNRIGHLEPIVKRSLDTEHDDIIDLISWICKDTAAWVKAHSTFPKIFAEGPDAVIKEASILNRASLSFLTLSDATTVREACEELRSLPKQTLVVTSSAGPFLLTKEQLGKWVIAEATNGIVDFDDITLKDVASAGEPTAIVGRKCGLTELISVLRANDHRHVLITETGKPTQKVLGVLDVHDLM
jgi:hypothetical protein